MLTAEDERQTYEDPSPETLARILDDLGYKPPRSSAPVQETLEWAFALENSVPFLEWLCVAFGNDGGVAESKSNTETCRNYRAGWDVLSSAEYSTYEELKAMGFVNEEALEGSLELMETGPGKGSPADIEADMVRLEGELKRVQEEIKTMDLQLGCLKQSQVKATIRAEKLTAQSEAAERTLNEVDLETSNLSLRMDAAMTEAADSCRRIVNLSTLGNPPMQPTYLHQCAPQISELINVDEMHERFLSSGFAHIFPQDPRQSELPIFDEPLSPQIQPSASHLHIHLELAAEMDRMRGLLVSTEREHYTASLRAHYSESKMAALVDNLGNLGSNPCTTACTPTTNSPDDADDVRAIVNMLHPLWQQIAAMHVVVPFLHEIFQMTMKNREKRLKQGAELIRHLRQQAARLMFLGHAVRNEKHCLREQGHLLQAVAETLTCAHSGVSTRLNEMSQSRNTKPASSSQIDVLSTLLSRVAGPCDESLAKRIAQDGTDAARAAHDAEHQADMNCRTSVISLKEKTDALLTLLYEHAVTAEPLLVPKDLLDAEHRVREKTGHVGRMLHDAARVTTDIKSASL
ncbi:hypothetical protein DFJ77DRAFT_460783 [Powellomyces hirtus]|nr:hypothetical protein DFJ77DRAFT_460783 [Powellomyces hirtus]